MMHIFLNKFRFLKKIKHNSKDYEKVKSSGFSVFIFSICLSICMSNIFTFIPHFVKNIHKGM